MSRRPFTITKLHQDEDGVWRGRVTCDGDTIEVDREHGSWQANVTVKIPTRGRPKLVEQRRDVLPHVAEALQAKLPASEQKIPTTKKKREEEGASS